MPRLILMGPPGAGKGTQGKRIAAELRIPVVSTGDILREKKNEASEQGRQIREIMAEGRYVPDDVVIEMLRERISQNDCTDGFILDGFPRTVAQADALDHLLERLGTQLDGVVLIEVPKADLLGRLTGRRICSACGREYHTEFRPPASEGICDADGAALIQREDDKESTIRNRLDVYEQQTMPLVDYYRRKGTLRPIDGVGEFDEVFARAMAAAGAD